jgi:entry exclusion lipoprotein TrbK
MNKLLVLAVAAIALAACSNNPVVRGAATTVIQERQAMNDNQARLSLLSLCDMSVGSKNRALSPSEAAMVEAMCGGEDIDQFTPEDLQKALTVLKGFNPPTE